jgi:hypothetical protein
MDRTGRVLQVGYCRELELLKPDDKPLVRLWAQFADPKQRGQLAFGMESAV